MKITWLCWVLGLSSVSRAYFATTQTAVVGRGEGLKVESVKSVDCLGGGEVSEKVDEEVGRRSAVDLFELM